MIFGYSPKERKQCGLGADDKNGLFIALECLASYDAIKCAFFVGEEIGCKGSGAVDISFFDDCRYCIQIDRRGNSDMVTDIYSINKLYVKFLYPLFWQEVTVERASES